MPRGNGKLGRPTIAIGTLGGVGSGGSVMPKDVIRDNFDIAFERRMLTEDRRDPVNVLLPVTGSTTSDELIIDNFVTNDTRFLKIRATLRDLVRSGSGSTLIKEIADDEIITIEIQSKGNGEVGAPPATYATIRTFTLKQTTKGSEGLDVEIPIEDRQVGGVQALITRTGTVSLPGPELRLQIVFNGPQHRKVTTIVGHVDGTSVSTISNAFDAFIDSDTITDPIMYTANAEGTGMIPARYNGAYELDRINVVDEQNALSRIRISLCLTHEWGDSDPTGGNDG